MVLSAPLYPADVYGGNLSPFAYSAYQPTFHREAFAPHFGYNNYVAPSHQFADYAVAPTPYAAAPITQYVHSFHVPVAAPQIKYVEVPVPTPVVHVAPKVIVTKVVEPAPAPAPAPAPVHLDSRESAESVEVDSRED